MRFCFRLTSLFRAALLGSAIFFLCLAALPAHAQERINLAVPFMPATPQKVLQDIGAPADVQAVVKGSWGYERSASMLLGNPYHGKNQFFDVHAFEAELIELRNMEEFYTVPGDGFRHLPMHFLITRQAVHTEPNGRRFDQVEADVSLLPEQFWPELDNLIDSGADSDQINAYCRDKLKVVQRTYWFDITLPYNDNVEYYSQPSQ